MKRPTYEEAKQTKEILLNYLKNYVNNYDEITVNCIEKTVLFIFNSRLFS